MYSSMSPPHSLSSKNSEAIGRVAATNRIQRSRGRHGHQHSRRRKLVAATSFPFFFLFLMLRTGSADWANVSTQGDRQIEQRFAMEPQDQTAIIGSRVTLPCRVVNKSGQLQWTKDDFGLGTYRNLSGFERYTMIGSDEEGDFSLDISPVMLDDDANYQCQVGPGKGGTPGIRSRFAKLTVLVPPEAPKIVQGDFMVATEDREIELECVSIGGKPAAEITWIDGLGNVHTQGTENMKEPLRDSRRYTAKSILKLTPKKDHHNTTFTCQAQNTADRTYRSVRVKLEVKYAPKIRIAVIGGALTDGRILEGTEVRLSCHADANPQDLTYRWFIGNVLSENNHGQELLIENVSRYYHDTIVRCEAHNAVGRSEESETLDISYGPSFRMRPKSMEADLDTTVTFVCDVDGNPAPSVFWVHELTNRVVSSGPNLTLIATHATSGRYYCKASVAGFPEIEADAIVQLRGPPTITSPRQQFGALQDHAQLECLVTSIPRPLNVQWSFNGRDLNASEKARHGEYRAIETVTPNGVRATLVVNHCRWEHFGRYNCTVTNDYGIDFLEIHFISKEQNLLPIIVLGSLGGVTFLIIVIIIGICLCSRHKKKKHLPSADVIPKCEVPSKDCGDGSVGIHNGNIKIARNDDLLDGEQNHEGNTKIAVSVRACHATGSSPTTRIMNSPLAALKGDIMANYSQYFGDFTESISHLQQTHQQQKSSPASTEGKACNNGYMPYINYARDYSATTQHLMEIKGSTNNNSIENCSALPGKQAWVGVPTGNFRLPQLH